MKRIISVVMVLCLMLSILPVSAASNDNAGLKQLPQVGEVISGFKTTEVSNLDIINSKAALFKHEKSGAELLYIQNKDLNRSFDITFRTPAVDNTGANHILEHISVSGSKKYPIKNILFTVANQTYSTFINAFTSQNFTTYPVSSMSEAQLLKFTDMYMDCVFNPSVYDDKNIFAREAWRYEMADENSPLTITGTVYNEMKGSLGNINTAAYQNVLKTLFAGSIQANISGGDPKHIPELSYDKLIQTHKNYYHPSNALIILYGNLDYEKFLKHIDVEYLSKYDKKDMKLDFGKVEPKKEMVSQTYQFPVSANANTKGAAEIDYAYAMTDLSLMDTLGLQIMAAYLNQQTSPLQQAFNKQKIGGTVAVNLIDNSYQPVLLFSAYNADEKKANEFKKLVDSTMKEITVNGINKESIDAVVQASLLGNSNLTEDRILGINMSIITAKSWSVTGKTDLLGNIISYLKDIGVKSQNGYIEGLIDKYIIKNQHAALVTTIPEAGLAEKLEQEQQKQLADLKASMSKAEIAKIISDTNEYIKWNNKADNEKVIESIKVVNASELPVEVKKYVINDTKLNDGVRLVSAEADVGEIATTTLYLDASGVPAEKLHYLKLYSDLLGSLGTKNYSSEQLNIQRLRYLNQGSVNISTIKKKDKSFTPYLTINWAGLIGEYPKQIELVKEIMLNTLFSNKTEIANTIKVLKSNIKNSINNEPISLLISRNRAQFDDDINYHTYLSDLEYYKFLEKLEKLLEEKPEEVTAQLEYINKLLINKTNMVAVFTGNKNNVSKYEAAIKGLLPLLPGNEIKKQDYSVLPKPDIKEGIALDTAVQYNMVSATYEQMGTEFSGKYLPIGALIGEKYITPAIRFGNGAYDSITNFNTSGFMVASYRDPNIKETYEVFSGLSNFLKNVNLTDKELERYILKTFGEYTAPSGELTGANNSALDYLEGRTDEEKLKILNEIKALKVEDVKDAAQMIDKLMKNGAYSTIGSSQKLSENKALFNTIITAFDTGAVSNETITRAQLFEMLLQGVPKPIETAVQLGLLTGDGKGSFHENEKLTREQLAVIMMKVVKMYGKTLEAKDVSIADIGKVSSWSKEAVKAVVGSGFMKLDQDGNFNPKGELTSADIQAILMEVQTKLAAK